MDIVISALKKAVVNYRGIVIYGCGKMANETYGALLKCGKRPKFCVVSQKSNVDEYFQDGIPVYEFSTRADYIKENNILVIIGVSSLYEKEIEETLQRYQIKKYILITHFERLVRYEYMSARECLEEITEWYMENHIGEAREESKNVLKRLRDAIEKEKDEKKSYLQWEHLHQGY